MFIPVTDLQCVLFLVCVWHTVIIFKTANITNFVKKNCLFTYFCINEIAVIMLHYHLNVAYPLQEIRCYGLKMCWESRTFTTKLSPPNIWQNLFLNVYWQNPLFYVMFHHRKSEQLGEKTIFPLIHSMSSLSTELSYTVIYLWLK